eukprot:scaffold5700_cov89-Cyclotella_meneghiniana.AAC.1
MPRQISAEESSKRDREHRDLADNPPPDLASHIDFPLLLTNGEEANNSSDDLGLSQSSQESDTPAPKRTRREQRSISARDDPCCSCGPRNKCMRTASCACRIARRACTNCDPACNGTCMNLGMQPPRRVLMEAFRRQQERADEERNNTPGDGTLAITDGTDNTEHAADPSNGLDDNTNTLVASQRGQNPPDSTQLIEASSRHDDAENNPSGNSENGETQQQQQTEGAGDDTANGGNGDRTADPASDNPRVGEANTND